MARSTGILESIVAAIATIDGVTWGTPPFAVWYPEFEIENLQLAGLTAIVFIPTTSFDKFTRGDIAGDAAVHIAVTKPIGAYLPNSAERLADGATVVNAAEAVARKLMDGVLGQEFAAVLKVDNEPVISADYAKQYRLWASYLKLELVVNGA